MWNYEKKLQYPVKIQNPNPALAKLIITQLGGLYSLKIQQAGIENLKFNLGYRKSELFDFFC